MPSCQIIQFPDKSRTDMPANILNLASYTVTSVDNEVSKNYGSDISTLARLIEAGEL